MYAKIMKMLVPSHNVLRADRERAILAAWGIDVGFKSHSHDWIAYRMLAVYSSSNKDICDPLPYGLFGRGFMFFELADAMAAL